MLFNHSIGRIKLIKIIVVITGRVHPAETVSSYEIEGLMNYLLSTDRQAVELRNRFVFCIVPMLNPDGVVFGNSRCSVFGEDLNRRWIDPKMEQQASIFYTKQLLQEAGEEGGLYSFCDLHGHSARKDIFLLGCQPPPSDLACIEKFRKIKIFAHLLAKLNPHFSVTLSQFFIDKSKESTGRVVVFKEFGIPLSFTLETSMFGSGGEPECIFTPESLRNVGKDLAVTYFVCDKLQEGGEIQSAVPLRKQLEEILHPEDLKPIKKPFKNFKPIELKTKTESIKSTFSKIQPERPRQIPRVLKQQMEAIPLVTLNTIKW